VILEQFVTWHYFLTFVSNFYLQRAVGFKNLQCIMVLNSSCFGNWHWNGSKFLSFRSDSCSIFPINFICFMDLGAVLF
jgi:hypothetical protein